MVMSGTLKKVQAATAGSRMLAAVALLPALAVAWQSAVLVRDDLAFTASQTEVSFWGRGDYRPTPATRQRTEHAVEALLADNPSQPDYLELAAGLYAWQGYWVQDPEQAAEYNRRAVRAQYAAQVARPAYRPGWELLMEYAGRNGDLRMIGLAGERLAALRPASTAAAVNPMPAAGLQQNITR